MTFTLFHGTSNVLEIFLYLCTHPTIQQWDPVYVLWAHGFSSLMKLKTMSRKFYKDSCSLVGLHHNHQKLNCWKASDGNVWPEFGRDWWILSPVILTWQFCFCLFSAWFFSLLYNIKDWNRTRIICVEFLHLLFFGYIHGRYWVLPELLLQKITTARK